MKPTSHFRVSNWTLDAANGFGAANRLSRRLMRRARGREQTAEIDEESRPEPENLRAPFHESMHDEDDATWGYLGWDWNNDMRPLSAADEAFRDWATDNLQTWDEFADDVSAALETYRRQLSDP